jgi:hypothetical protein
LLISGEPTVSPWLQKYNGRQTKISSHIDLINIQVTDGKMGLDAPMRLLSKVPHNVNSELVVWNVNCFTIITSYNCWRPPTHMLENINKTLILQE